MKDKAFYDAESVKYSSKRYPEKASDFIHFFFKERLEVSLRELDRHFKGARKASLLEVGCADGVVLRAIRSRLPDTFGTMVGIDLSDGMIGAAKGLTDSPETAYYVRGQEPKDAYDAVVEIGVANYADFDGELVHAALVMRPDAVFILSMAGSSSVSARLGKSSGYRNLDSYRSYEERIKKLFDIERMIPVGLYMPGFWKVPALARFAVPIVEAVLRKLVPGLYHEKVYVLRKRSDTNPGGRN